MKPLPTRFIEDKALRDAAKAVLDADLALFKAGLAEKGIAGRLRDQITGKVRRRVVGGARDVLEQAKTQASDHPGALAVLIGAIILWFAREPLLGLLGLGDDDAADGAEFDDASPEPETFQNPTGIKP